MIDEWLLGISWSTQTLSTCSSGVVSVTAGKAKKKSRRECYEQSKKTAELAPQRQNSAIRPNNTLQSKSNSTQQSSLYTAQQGPALVTSAMCWLEDTKKKNHTYKANWWFTEKNCWEEWTFSIRGTTASALSCTRTITPKMSWTMSPPPFGTFFCSSFGFYSHFMAATPLETPRTNIAKCWPEWWSGFW